MMLIKLEAQVKKTWIIPTHDNDPGYWMYGYFTDYKFAVTIY